MITMAGKSIRRWWALFALPTFAAFIIGFLVPFILGVYLSFCKFTTVTDAHVVGLRNYRVALQDKEFWHAMGYTTAFTIVTTIIINVVAFAIAYMLTKAFKGTNVFRSVFFMPNLIGGIILGYVWLLLLNGVLAHWARSITYSSTYGFWGMVMLLCWQQIGYMMIIYVAGLQSLPTDVIERPRLTVPTDASVCSTSSSAHDAEHHRVHLPDHHQRLQDVRSEPRAHQRRPVQHL